MRTLFAVLILFISINLNASAFFTGQLFSVSRDGAFDVMRNPALMVHAPSDAFGFMSIYRAVENVDSDVSLNVDADYSRNDKSSLKGAYNAAYLRKNESAALGIGLTQTNGMNYSRDKYGDEIVIIGSNHIINTSYDKKEMNQAVVLSRAWLISDDFSFGVSFKTGYSRESENKYKIEHDGANIKEEDISIDKNRVTGELNLGVLLKEDYFELGAVVSSGKLVYFKESYKNIFELNAGGPQNFSDSFSREHYDGMPGVIFGLYIRPFESTAFAFEAGYLFGGAWKSYEFNFDSGIPDLETNSTTVKTQPVYISKAGVELFLSEALSFSLGSSFYSLKVNIIDEINSNTIIKISSFETTAGFNWRFNENSNFLLGAVITQKREKLKKDESSFTLNYKADTEALDLCFGISYGL